MHARGMGFIEYHKADCMLSVLISTHLLLAARDNGVKRLFFSSSACVYNADRQLEGAVCRELVARAADGAVPG